MMWKMKEVGVGSRVGGAVCVLSLASLNASPLSLFTLPTVSDMACVVSGWGRGGRL